MLKGTLKSKMKYHSSESMGLRELKYYFKNFFRPLTAQFGLKIVIFNCTWFFKMKNTHCKIREIAISQIQKVTWKQIRKGKRIQFRWQKERKSHFTG